MGLEEAQPPKLELCVCSDLVLETVVVTMKKTRMLFCFLLSDWRMPRSGKRRSKAFKILLH